MKFADASMTDQHYRDSAGRVHYLSASDHARAQACGMALPAPDWTPITTAEAMVLATPPPTPEQMMAAVRAERDRRLAASDIMVLPDRWEGYNPDQRAAWTAYRQALRDLPAITVTPSNPEWPVPPAS